MLTLVSLYTCLYLFRFASSSTLTAPPLSALVIAFENVYDLSLLANTLSDQGIDTTLIIPKHTVSDVYNKLIDVEVLQLDVNIDKKVSADKYALEACNVLFETGQILAKVQEFQPTFTIFPALRHDGCLLPFTKRIGSIPVIWIKNPDEELYTFEYTRVALPMHSGGFWSRLLTSFSRRTIFSTTKNEYLTPVLRLVITKHMPNINIDLEQLYSDVRLVLWGGDTVLRSDFASLTELLVEVGCHHCRGAYPLPENLQKSLIEYRSGTIVALLEENYEMLIRQVASNLLQGKEGQALIWKSKSIISDSIPENLFIDKNVDRQDIIGYSRTRVVLSHCTDTEFLEAAFHRTPLICLPRDAHESRNAARAVELGFARSTKPANDFFLAVEVAKIVDEIHETVAYRENARKVSVAIRDRLNPPSDRLVYWLGYVARTKDDTEKFHKPNSQTRTLTEDIQFFVGLLAGVIIGIVCTGSAVVARYLVTAKKVQIAKGRYMQ